MTTDKPDSSGPDASGPITPQVDTKHTPIPDMIGYATGEGASSLLMNPIFTFGLLLYTKALGMDPLLAGMALGAATLWDAITDPIMGHISDHTRSRYGRRHPYIFVGGVLSVLFYCAIWIVPEFIRESAWTLPVPGFFRGWISDTLLNAPAMFWYLVIANLCLRTSLTVFMVPYTALGFEVCTDYKRRSTLQGIRTAFNMIINLGSVVTVWNFFLADKDGVSGATVASNYAKLGITFAAIAFVLMITSLVLTRKYAADSRQMVTKSGKRLRDVFIDLGRVLIDPIPRAVFCFVGILFIGVVLVTGLQGFIYEDVMKFPKHQTTIVHGSTTILAAIGALLATPLVNRFDKKPAIAIGIISGVITNGILLAIFYTGLIQPGAVWKGLPIAMLVFLMFHPIYHAGSTMATAIGISMIADASEIRHRKTGELKDGSYSAMFSFLLKAGISIGAVIQGYLMKNWIGYTEGADFQTLSTQKGLLVGAFLVGSAVGLVALASITFYPVNKAYMDQLRNEETDPKCEQCGTNLKGTTLTTCPECGRPIPVPIPATDA